MAVLIDKKGNIVATHLIKITGHYDPKRWDKDKVIEFIEEKMQLLKDKADIELLQIDGDNVDAQVYVSKPDKPPHIMESYAHLWMMTNEIIRQNGLFVDEIDVDENNFEKGMYPIIGYYNYKAKDEEVKATPG